MPHADVAIGIVEHRLSVRLAGNVRVPPEHLDHLLRVPFDRRQAHPNARRTINRIPIFDLILQWLASRCGKTKVRAIGFGLREIEPIFDDPYQ